VTQVYWSGPGPTAPSVPAGEGGESPAPADPITVQFERWTLTGQPLRQIDVRSLPPETMAYRAASERENAHC